MMAQSRARAWPCGATSVICSKRRTKEAVRAARSEVRCLHRCSRQSRAVARRAASEIASGSCSAWEI